MFHSRSESDTSSVPALKTREWIKLFKSYQVLIIESQNLCRFLFPVVIIFCISLSIVCNYLAIKIEGLLISIRLSIIVVSGVLIVSVFTIFYMVEKLAAYQEVSIRCRKLTLSTKCYRKHLNSFRIQKFSIVSLFYVDRILPFTILHLIVDITISALITFK